MFKFNYSRACRSRGNKISRPLLLPSADLSCLRQRRGRSGSSVSRVCLMHLPNMLLHVILPAKVLRTNRALKRLTLLVGDPHVLLEMGAPAESLVAQTAAVRTLFAVNEADVVAECRLPGELSVAFGTAVFGGGFVDDAHVVEKDCACAEDEAAFAALFAGGCACWSSLRDAAAGGGEFLLYAGGPCGG